MTRNGVTGSMVSALALVAALPMAATAQQAPTPTPTPTPQAAPTPAPAAGTTRRPATPRPARAKPAAVADDANSDEPDIIVTGQRNLPGAVIGDIPPEQQLGPADIRSYGVSSVSDLLTELAPQIRSDRGSGGFPVVLLNGRRISGFQEVRDLPTEAIARVDILPEEVALKYGYPADQKVVNIVLRRRFRATTVELADRQATEGGQNSPDANVDLLSIKGAGRFNVHFHYTQSSMLTEAERDIVEQPSLFATAGNVAAPTGGIIDPRLGTATVAGVPAAAASGPAAIGQFTPGVANADDQGRYRTLLPSTRALTANMVYATNLFDNHVGASFNAELETSDSTGMQGLPGAVFTLPAGNPFSPFVNTVLVDRALAGFGPLNQNSSSVTGHLGSTFNGNIGHWRWSLTGSLDHVHSETFTDVGVDTSGFQARLNAGDAAANPFGVIPVGGTGVVGLPGSIAHSTSTSGGVDALFNGTVFDLPAGSVSTSIRVGGSVSDFSSDSLRTGVTSSADVSRDIVDVQLNVDVPLTSRAKGVLAAIGTLSINGNIAVHHLSDFGTLTTRGYGFNWAPRDGIRLLGSVTDQDDAPTQQQLGNPVIVTPGVRVFDYVMGTTATVTTVGGGNAGLVADRRHTAKLELNLKPWKTKDITFVANYITSHTDNAIVAFPTPTAEIESAFPGRFTRDGAGNLTRLDTRPINFARTSRSEIRYGINFSHSLKSRLQKQIEAFRAGTGPNPFAGLAIPDFFRRQRGGTQGGQAGTPGGRPGGDGAPPPPTGDGAPPTAGTSSTTGGTTPPPPPPSGGGFGGFGGGGGGGGGRGPGGGGFGGGGGRQQGGGRIQFALYHTWHFTDRVLVSPTGPALDLLNGDAIGQSGGQSRHELEGQAGYSNNGLGVRLSANYASGTSINGGTSGVLAGAAGNATTLNFSSLTTLNLRLFADATGRIDLLVKHPWLRGVRATLELANVFDSRQRVTDQTGTTPISYQPDYLNPLGRTVRLSIRKLFF